MNDQPPGRSAWHCLCVLKSIDRGRGGWSGGWGPGGVGGGGVEGERDTISWILWPLRGVACTSCSKPWTCSKEPVACSKPWTCSNEPVACSKPWIVFKEACFCSKPWTCSVEPVACSKPWTCSKKPVAVQSRGPVQRSLLLFKAVDLFKGACCLFKAVDLFKGACCCSKPWTCLKEAVAVQSRGPVQRSLFKVSIISSSQ